MKQIFETLFSKTGSSFRKVALVEFPAPGMWSLVFLSQPPGSEVAAKLPQGEHVSVFLPCTPNPTTGFFFFVKRSELHRARHLGRERHDAADLGRHGAAGRRRAEEARRDGRQCARGAGAAQEGRRWSSPSRRRGLAARLRRARTGGQTMGFVEAIRSGFQQLRQFLRPRAALGILVLDAVRRSWSASSPIFIDVRLSSHEPALRRSARSGPSALFLPGIAVSVRRLHDIDRTGWWLLLVFTIIGIIRADGTGTA